MNNNKELIELKETNKNNNKLLLIVEIFLLITSILSFTVMIIAADYLSNTNNILKFSLISTAILILPLSIIFSFIIEKEAGIEGEIIVDSVAKDSKSRFIQKIN